MEKNILVIDHDQEFQKTVQSLLETEGYNVISATLAENGLEQAKTLPLLKEEKPDLVLLDLGLSGDTGGFDVSVKLKEDASTREIPIVAVRDAEENASSNMSYTPDRFYLPVNTVLDKSVQSDVLLKTIKNYL